MNDHPTTLSEVEHYYQEREQRLLEKLHQQEAALTVAEQTLKQLIKNQKAQLDGTGIQRRTLSRFSDRCLQPPLLRRSCP